MFDDRSAAPNRPAQLTDATTIRLRDGFANGPPRVEQMRLMVALVHRVLVPDGAPLPAGAASLVTALIDHWRRLGGRGSLVVGPGPARSEAELAARLRAEVDDPALRVQLLRVLIVAVWIGGRPTPVLVAAVTHWARVLAVVEPALADLELHARGRVLRLRSRVLRRMWAFEIMRERVDARGRWEFVRIVLALLGCYRNADMLARYRGLAELPADSVGQALLAYYRANDFALPGDLSASPEVIVQHDLAHVLSGYGTEPDSEVEAGCFMAGYRERDAFCLLVFVLLQFQLGVRLAPQARATRGMFDPDRALTAIWRASAVPVDLSRGDWDYWPLLARPLDEVRRCYGVREGGRPG